MDPKIKESNTIVLREFCFPMKLENLVSPLNNIFLFFLLRSIDNPTNSGFMVFKLF